MPNYNKGDFTQQGVAGDVTALVRLNEKRTVKLTLSADDASNNCDISGSVIDELNDKIYPIGAGVSGNIEITENGENFNVAPYATATVNVSGGGGDAGAYCTVTVVNDTEQEMGSLIIDPETLILSHATIAPSESFTTICFYYFDSEDLNSYVVMANPFRISDQQYPMLVCTSAQATNLVNIEWAEIYGGSGYLKVTDNILPSSCTIPASVFLPS